MEYKPGIIHESFQKIHAIEMLQDFNIPVLKKRWSDTNLIDDDSTIILNVSKGDILTVRFFKPSTTSTTYTYIEKLITGSTEHLIMSECTLSREFVVKNTQELHNGVLFSVVTKQYERDKKIESILS